MPSIVADLHIHSHFSRATSPNLNLEHLCRWAQLKGVQVVGTGDIAHPGWLQEMKQKLEPAEEGLFRLKDEYAQAIRQEVPPACQAPVRFMLAGEVSNIYKKDGAVRKIHHILFAPHFAAVEKLQAALEKIGNIRADGRPILGLDSRDLLEIVLETDPHSYLIPAHIWTPWFAILGSKSGFDSIKACFEDLTPHIFALETGLSSDPPMNWQVSALDRFTLISNSDAHSPPKLAREATLFDTELAYPALFDALKRGDPATFGGTIEFFPEEGKYHVDGHRKCNIRWEPAETRAHQGLCPVCGKQVTVGVMNRVAALADRKPGANPAQTHPYFNLISLPEILAEVAGVGAGSKQVQQVYDVLLAKLGPELAILREVPCEEIEAAGGALLAEGIRRMRAGELSIAAGYDGEYGVIKLFDAQEREASAGQIDLFGAEKKRLGGHVRRSLDDDSRQGWSQTDLFAAHPSAQMATPPKVSDETALYASEPTLPALPPEQLLAGLNDEQRAAVRCVDSSLLIVAGPGTGKTRTLTHRIAYLLAQHQVAPESILAITFTNKATEEMRDRLIALVGERVAERIEVKTFHAFGAWLLRTHGETVGVGSMFAIASEDDRLALLRSRFPEWSEKNLRQALDQISTAKNQLQLPHAVAFANQVYNGQNFSAIYREYETALRTHQTVDFDDLLLLPVQILTTQLDVLNAVQRRFQWISVDEYQDINLAQEHLLRLLTSSGANLCAIGDPDQAIYGFRGADRRYFLAFMETYPGARVMRLSQNYRSTQLILEASSQVIAGNPDESRLRIWSEFLEQTRLEMHQAATGQAEAEYVVHQIEQLVGGTSLFSLDSGRVAATTQGERTFGDFAVLYRLNAQSQVLAEAFERSGIPFQTVGQTPLTEYKEIREILAYLWLVFNPESVFYLEYILNAEQTLFPSKTLERLAGVTQSEKRSLWAVLQDYEALPFVNLAQRRLLAQVVPFLSSVSEVRATLNISRLIERIYSFVGQSLARPYSEKQQERIQQLSRRAAPYAHRLDNFLESITLQRETDLYDPRADRVTLMTLHAAKGLEFPVVFFIGCEETLIPHQLPGKETDIEEERRLFYVGMTRAQQRLVLTHARTRFLFGQSISNPPSRFLADIEETLKELKTTPQRKQAAQKPEFRQLSMF
jgi:uncharacterized protein (TIGR00375 family)